jgi:hypothetical protein
MKRYSFLIGLFFVTTMAYAQQSQEVAVADRIAQKMKDSLNLSKQQKEELYAVNLRLHAGKMKLREQYRAWDSLSKKTQRVENTRDSLYRFILTAQQFEAYRLKKRSLVSAD